MIKKINVDNQSYLRYLDVYRSRFPDVVDIRLIGGYSGFLDLYSDWIRTD